MGKNYGVSGLCPVCKGGFGGNDDGETCGSVECERKWASRKEAGRGD